MLTRLDGAPTVGTIPVKDFGAVRVGDLVETDDSSRVRINVGAIGCVNLEPNTRVHLIEARSNEHRLALDRGTIHAMIAASPRLFFVENPSAVATDLGYAYALTVDDQNHGLLRVTAGWVELEHDGRISLVSAGMLCETRPGIGPGLPFSGRESASFRQALTLFDFEDGGLQALNTMISEARDHDALTLWHLLSRVDQSARGQVYDRMTTLVPPPREVTRDGILRLDPRMLNLLKYRVSWL